MLKAQNEIPSSGGGGNPEGQVWVELGPTGAVWGGWGVCVTVSQPGLTAVSPADTQSPRPAFPDLAWVNPDVVWAAQLCCDHGHALGPDSRFWGFLLLCSASVTLLIPSLLFLSITEHTSFLVLLPKQPQARNRRS